MFHEAGETVWLLDLDNTLHDASAQIMPRINRMMTRFVSESLGVDELRASEIRVEYWRRYGATLLGLVRHHGVDPAEFLAACHDFPDLHLIVRPDMRLVHALRRLPGRRVLLTNAPRAYATQVVRALGIAPLIDEVVPIESMVFTGRWQPKPSRAMMRRLLARLRVPAARCVLVEDTAVNLHHARWLGVRTVLVTSVLRSLAQHAPRRRVGRGRRIQHQVQSVASIMRVSIRRPSNGERA
ncbi:MAG: pyrimidine 5'-nucleotidase [Burkholderiaceae bacterium]